ncbi:hypothetical protein [Nocardia sp. NPDC047648]|uniref:hypothetical protein n=1 Tax=Nocardia sp. NPDC047648 TaxID=3155625 RepID=UPI0033CEDFF5
MTGLHHHERGWGVGTERRRDGLGHRLDRLAVLGGGGDEQTGLRGQQILQRPHRTRLQEKDFRSAGELGVGDDQLRACAFGGERGEFTVEAEDIADLGMGLGSGLRVLGESGQRGLQVAGCGEEAAADGGAAVRRFGVPRLAQVHHPAVEGLLHRIGGEVVLADPVLADDDGVERRHGH